MEETRHPVQGEGPKEGGEVIDSQPVVGKALPYALAAGVGAGLTTGDAVPIVTAIVAVYPYAHLFFRRRSSVRRRGDMPCRRKQCNTNN